MNPSVVTKNLPSVVEVQTLTNAPTLFEMNPNQMVAYAASMADTLSRIIDDRRLYTTIGGKKHVRVEGWCTLGSMLGFLPREVEVKALSDGSYEAKVELYSLKTGQIVGSASSICTIDEKRWGNADRYARRSMAVTRATGKAYRLGFAWIMALAGYEGTPAEEMPYDEPPVKTVSKPPVKGTLYDPENPSHVLAVEAQCKASDIHEKHWPEVKEMMQGRLSTELKEVVGVAKQLQMKAG